MVHPGRQCESVKHGSTFGSLMGTEEERAPSGHGKITVHPLDEVVVKGCVTSFEDVNHRIPFVVKVVSGIGQFTVWQQVRLFQYHIELVLYICQYAGSILLSPFEVVFHCPAVFS